MKRITKAEAMWLDKKGYFIGERVFSTKHKFYATEDSKVSEELENFRKERK